MTFLLSTPEVNDATTSVEVAFLQVREYSLDVCRVEAVKMPGSLTARWGGAVWASPTCQGHIRHPRKPIPGESTTGSYGDSSATQTSFVDGSCSFSFQRSHSRVVVKLSAIQSIKCIYLSRSNVRKAIQTLCTNHLSRFSFIR